MNNQSEIVLIKLLESTAREQLPLVLPYITGLLGGGQRHNKRLTA
jgi:hypothetical protein